MDSRKLIIKILRTWVGLGIISLIAYFIGFWADAQNGILGVAVALPIWFYFQYRKTRMNEKEDTPHKNAIRPHFWNAQNTFAFYGISWVLVLLMNAIFLLYNSGNYPNYWYVLVSSLCVAFCVGIVYLSRKLTIDNSANHHHIGWLQWDEQSQSVFYGTTRAWLQLSALGVIIYLIGWWSPVILIFFYAIATVVPLYFFIRTKQLKT